MSSEIGISNVASLGNKLNLTSSTGFESLKVGETAVVGTNSAVGTSLDGVVKNFVEVLNKAESTSIAGIKGEATAYQVASSVMEAEQSLKITMAIRDKIVSAYLEISRMQI